MVNLGAALPQPADRALLSQKSTAAQKIVVEQARQRPRRAGAVEEGGLMAASPFRAID